MLPSWQALALRGTIGIVLGVILVFLPHVTLAVLVLTIAAYAFFDFVALWAMVSGMLELILGWQSRMRPGLGVRLSVAGGISIVLGALIYAEPMVGAVAFARLMAAYGIAFGAALLSMAIHVRAQDRRLCTSRAS